MTDAARALGEGHEQTLRVRREVLDAIGASAVLVRSGPGVAATLPPLLSELRDEACVHSWRRRLPPSGPIGSDVAAQLLADEDAHRPTTTFVYVVRRRDGSEQVGAAAAVSERIRADFAHDGFPVLARCYIRPEFRRRGLYRSVLRHRFDYCLKQWGDSLRAIHLGSADPTIWRVATMRPDLVPPFVHVGDEDLEVAGHSHAVRDLLAFAPRYVEQLLESVRALGDGTYEVRALHDGVQALVDPARPETGVVAVRALVARASEALQLDVTQRSDALRALMALADAIPIVR